MNTNERPTPETDAEELHDPHLVRELPFCVVRIDFARRLERQRNKAREFAKDLTDKYLEASGLLQRQLAEAREAFAIATDQLVQVQGELRQAREENARLREAIWKVLNIIPPPTCDQMHHAKKERHEYGTICPPVERVKAIIDNARKLLTP